LSGAAAPSYSSSMRALYFCSITRRFTFMVGVSSYDVPPTNSLAAESRRIARFFAFGHTPGPVAVPPDEHNPDFPFTLDLRRPRV